MQSFFKKISLGFLLLLSAMSGLTALSIDISLPTFPSIAEDLSTPVASIQTSLSCFVFCFGLGQLFFGPLSDRFGRRWPLLFSLVVYVAASMVSALAQDAQWLLMGRGLQGFGACGAAVSFMSVTRDLYSGRTLARVLAWAGSIATLAPLLAPLIGAQLQRVWGWRATFVFLALVGVFLGLFLWRYLLETHRTNQDAEGSDPRSRQSGFIQGVMQGYAKVLANPAFVRNALIHGIAFCGLFAFLSTGSALLIEGRGWSPVRFSFWFSGNALVFASGSLLTARLVQRFALRQLIMVGTAFVLVGASAMWTWGEATGVWGFMGSMFIATAGYSLIFPASAAAAMDRCTAHAAKGAALIGFTRFFLASVTGVLAAGMTTTQPLALVLVGSAGLCLMLTQWPSEAHWFSRRAGHVRS